MIFTNVFFQVFQIAALVTLCAADVFMPCKLLYLSKVVKFQPMNDYAGSYLVDTCYGSAMLATGGSAMFIMGFTVDLPYLFE